MIDCSKLMMMCNERSFSEYILGNNRQVSLRQLTNTLTTMANISNISAMEPISHTCSNTCMLEDLMMATSNVVCGAKFWAAIIREFRALGVRSQMLARSFRRYTVPVKMDFSRHSANHFKHAICWSTIHRRQ